MICRIPDTENPGEPMRLFNVTLRGSIVVTGAALASASLPNVTVGADEELFLFSATKQPGVGSVVTNNNSWNGITPTGAAQSVNFKSFTGASRCVFWNSPTPGTGTITINFTAVNKPSVVVMIAITVKKPTAGNNYDSAGFIPSTTDPGVPSDEFSVISPTGLPTTGPFWAIVGHAIHGSINTDDPGTWVDPCRGLIRDGNSEVILDIGYKEVPADEVLALQKTGFTSREWGLSGGAFTGIVVPSCSTSYDINRFEDGSPQNPVDPEISARIARGDVRGL